MTPAQLRAARALLNWSQKDLADKSGVGVATIRNFEANRSKLMPANRMAILRALTDAGVVLLDPDGAQRR